MIWPQKKALSAEKAECGVYRNGLSMPFFASMLCWAAFHWNDLTDVILACRQWPRNITQEHLTLISSIHRFPLSCCSALVTQFLPQFPSWAKCISKNGLKSVSNPALLQFQICQNIRCEWIFYEYSLDSSAGCNSNHINALILIH